MRLIQAIYPQVDFAPSIAPEKARSSCSKSFAPPSIVPGIPLKRVGNATAIVYASAVAHQWSAQSQCDVNTLATDVVTTVVQNANRLPTSNISPPLDPLLGTSITVTTTGIIQFEVGDRVIAAWLDHLIANTLPLQWLPVAAPAPGATGAAQPSVLDSPALFAVQHAHARCCSLLRLAQREQLIQLDHLDAPPDQWQLAGRVSSFTAMAQPFGDHVADRRLIGQLVSAIDQLSDWSLPRTPHTVMRAATAVAQAFQVYHSVHPLGRSRTTARQTTAVGPLGLVLATQRVLHILLQHGLSVGAATEL